MATVQVAVVNEDGNPLKGVTVAAYDLDNFPAIATTGQTDETGTVKLTHDGPAFYDAFDRRGVSFRDRVYQGKIQIQVISFSNYMNADYVVDSNGFGTHTALFGTGGAFEAAVNDQADRFIWICTTHSETVTSSVSLAGLANGQQIHVSSGGPYRPNITANFSGALFTQPTANAGTLWRYIFSGINFVAASTRTPSIFQPNAGVAAAPIEFWDCNFEGAGSWQFGLDLTGAGSATSSGMVFDNCRGTLVAFSKIASGAAATGPMIVRDCNMTITRFVQRTNDTDFESGSSYFFINNSLTVTGSGTRGGFSMTHTDGSGNIRVEITGNDIVYSGGDILFRFGTNGTTNVRDINVSGNNIYISSGDAAINFDSGNLSMTIENVSIVGNTIRGDGSGTAIRVDPSVSGTVTCTNSVFGPNSYRDWTTTVSTNLVTSFGSGGSTFAPTVTISGDPAIPHLVMNATASGWMTTEYRRSNVAKAAIGLFGSSGSPFDVDDLYFAVNNGVWNDLAAFDNTDLRFKINTDVTVDGYVKVGTTLTAPTNATADGDLSFIRGFIADDANAHIQFVSSNPRYTMDSGDWFQYLRASNRFEWSVGSANIAELDGNGDLRIAGYGRIGSLTAPANTTDGDLQVTRFMFGENVAFGTATDAVGHIMSGRGTMTNTAAGAVAFSRFQNDINPASNSSSEFRALYFVNSAASATGITLATLRAGYFDNRIRQDGTVTTSAGLTILAAAMDSTSPATVAATNIIGIDMLLARRQSGTSTGTSTATTGIMFSSSRFTAGWTITTARDMWLRDAAGTATVTTAVGIDQEKYTTGTTNIEYRNAGKMVYTPTSQTLGAAGDTIGSTARLQDVDNSTGASLTLTSTPTVTAGVADGQLLTITNVDSADNIVLQDITALAGSALRLPGAANLTLGPRDSVTLRWRAAASEWWAIASANL